MRMQVILDSTLDSSVPPPKWGGKKGEFRDWTILSPARIQPLYGAGRKESSGTGLFFRLPGFSPIWGGKKGEFRDWTDLSCVFLILVVFSVLSCVFLSLVEFS